MDAFQAGNVVFDQAAQPYHLDGVHAKRLLVMMAQGDEKKDAGQENDDDHSDGGTGEELEVKVPLAKKRVSEAGENRTPPLLRFGGDKGVGRRIYHKCV